MTNEDRKTMRKDLNALDNAPLSSAALLKALAQWRRCLDALDKVDTSGDVYMLQGGV